MTDAKSDLRQRLDGLIGKSVGYMNPVYLDPDFAAASRFGTISDDRAAQSVVLHQFRPAQ